LDTSHKDVRPDDGRQRRAPIIGTFSASFGRGITRKRIAAAFGIGLATSRDWLRDGVPLARRQEMARILEAELDRIEADIKRLREGR
jgi:phage terminase Nu1 subunit (DNA packaging protein)